MKSTNLKSFAAVHKLKVAAEDDGTKIIRGRTGQIYEYSTERLAVLYSNPKDLTSQRWNAARDALVKLGATVEQWGDREGTLSFDSTNPALAKLAISVARCKPKRVMSEAQRQNLTIARAKGLTALASLRSESLAHV